MEKALVTLNKTLEKILDDLEYKERDVKIEPVSSGGANYTTILFEITVSCPGKPTLELFAKVAIMNEILRKQMGDDPTQSPYYQEHRVYEELVGLYSEIESKHNVPIEHRYVFPKLYGSHLNIGEETFVMENLTKLNFHVFSRFNPHDWEHAAVSIRDLAKFHALSMALEKEYPEAYENFSATKMPAMDGFVNMIREKNLQNIELLPDEYKIGIQNFLVNNSDIFQNFMNSPAGKQVLIHGDYRTSNILYKRQAGQLISVPVDYQGVRRGNPFADFQYFLATGSDETFRKLCYNQLVDFFYNEMGHALKRLGLDISQEYSRHLFDEDHKLYLPAALFVSLTLLPMILVSEDEAPDVMDATMDMSGFFVNPNEKYRERLLGYVKDFAKWSVF